MPKMNQAATRFVRETVAHRFLNALARQALVRFALVVLTTVAAFGHAILLRSAPSLNQVVDGKRVPIELHFNSRIDGARSRLVLVEPGGKQQGLAIRQPSRDALFSDAHDLAPGPYILRWQILAEDGHITRGEVPFRAN